MLKVETNVLNVQYVQQIHSNFHPHHFPVFHEPSLPMTKFFKHFFLVLHLPWLVVVVITKLQNYGYHFYGFSSL